jgi:chloramphenicol 3-O phosphotransferase
MKIVDSLDDGARMDESVAAGKIILIDGPSSSGKTTISCALQAALDLPFWHFSIDHLRDGGVLPLKRIQNGDFDWPQLRPSFFEGFHRALPGLAGAGNNLIVEHIVETEAWMRRLVHLLSDFDVYFVGLRCSLSELEKRERARGNRRIGEARADHQRIQNFARYDLELDSTEPVESNVEKLVSSWAGRESPSAFDRMRAAV